MYSRFPPLIILIVFFAFNSLNSHSLSSKILCHEQEREALINLKTNVAQIPYSSDLDSWEGDDCCAWDGIKCNNITGNVIHLDLSDQLTDFLEPSSLDGNILSPLLSLHHLAYLDIAGNNFTGSKIPKFLGSMKSLKYLDISYTNFNGIIPYELANLSNLHELHMDGSSIENPGGLSRLKSLGYFALSSANLNKASGWLQALASLPYLHKLEFRKCDLNSTVQPSFVNFTSLTELDLSYNLVYPSLPEWIWNIKSLTYLAAPYTLSTSTSDLCLRSISQLRRLRYLDLSDNYLRCSLRDIQLPSTLQVLNLNGNLFYGSLPETIGNLSSLEELRLDGNCLDGSIPESISMLRRLRYLNLNNNLFIGTLPATIGNLSSLEEFSISGNNLTNQVPESIGQLGNIQTLDMGNNSISAMLTASHFTNMSRLTYLDFSHNTHISMKISDDWAPTFRLRELYLEFCEVGPKFPGWLKNQHSLETLKLSNAGIEDHVPIWFLNFSSTLQTVDLSNNGISGQIIPFSNPSFSDLNLANNSLSGPIPLEFAKKMVNLWSLDLSTNNFDGSFPSSFSEPNSLNVLKISNNKFSGELPNLPYSIIILKLSNNYFHGKIPQSLCNLTYLREFHSRYTIFKGEVPLCFENFTNLVSLDLGYNKLTGNIPPWIGTLMELKILSLTSNYFTGPIPYFSNGSSLQILDLSNNNLFGHIPATLGNLTEISGHYNTFKQILYRSFFRDNSMQLTMWLITKGKEYEYSLSMLPMVTLIDLSDNVLSGHIPDELGKLQHLVTLNLSGNNLVGQIPVNIDGMQQLESLDLSRNNLSGKIPWSLKKLHFLGYLNLSYNNLSGKIPNGEQLQSFDNPSMYEGNPYLCGFPLTRLCENDENRHGPRNNDEVHTGNDEDIVLLYIVVASGFVFGFWLIWGALILVRKWRIAYFEAIDRLYYKLFEST